MRHDAGKDREIMTESYRNPMYVRRARPCRKVSVVRVAKKTVSAVRSKMNDLYVLVAGIVLGLFVFMLCGGFAAAERGFNGGVGGELILASAVVVGVRYGWAKLKKRLKD